MKIIRLFALTFGIIPFFFSVQAQTHLKWEKIDLSTKQKAEFSTDLVLPSTATYFKASFEKLNAMLVSTSRTEITHLTLPIGKDGADVEADLVYDPVMSTGDQKKFKDIRTYIAYSATGTPMVGRAGISPDGFYGIFELEGRQMMIRPSAVERDIYVVYNLGSKLALLDFSALPGCGTETNVVEVKPSDVLNIRNEEKRLRHFTIAISCTSGYAEQIGATESNVMASVVQIVNLLNQRYNLDFGIRLNIMDNTSRLFNLDPKTDYFVNETVGLDLLQQNQDYLDSLVDNTLYDLAQVFTRTCVDVGGVVWGRACVSENKARGVSCRSKDEDYFFTTFKHEVGHQFSGGHTFNACNGSTQYNPYSSFEPGAGSTILSYGNNCGTDNVGDRVDYFHVGNIIEVSRYAMEIESKCGTWGPDVNHVPDVYLSMPEGRTIPILTPFELEGGATDIDGNNLTYNWEQYDLGEGDPLGTNFETGPLFVSQAPGGSGYRLFPTLTTINSGVSSIRERLPEVSRELNFKMAVRDNVPNIGAQAIASYKFNATAEAGPFKVTFPDIHADTSFAVGQYVEITWDVANTDQPPVDCRNVNILFSSTDGITWSDTLVANTPNDGRELVMMPRATGRARFKVKAADNIFLSLSGKSVKVVQPSIAGYSLDILPHDVTICKKSFATLNVKSISWKNFNSPVKLAVIDQGHTDLQVKPSKKEFLPGEPITLDLDAGNVQDAGTYTIRLMATADHGDTLFRSVILNIEDNGQNISSTISPVGNDQNVALKPVFSWKPVANSQGYRLQLASDPAFSSLILDVTTTSEEYLSDVNLNEATIYYWRVRSLGTCGYGRWSPIEIFRTISTQSAGILRLVNNEILKVRTDEKKPIVHDDLYYTSELNPGEALKYTILLEPEHGSIYLDGVLLKTGNTFTQDDVDGGKLLYSAEESGYQGEDRFAFLVSDESNVFIGPENFVIDIRDGYPSGTAHVNMDASLELIPNPANGAVEVILSGTELKNDLVLKVLDIRGIPVIQQTGTGMSQKKHINLASLPSGTYIVVVQSGNYIAKRRLVKI